MLYIFYAVTIVLLCLSIFSKNLFFKKMCLFVSFCFMFIFLGWAAGAYDVEIGISRYNNYANYESFTELGFQWLIIVGHNLNMNYRTFYVILSLFELVVIYWFIIKHSPNPLIVIALFMLYPMVMYFQYTRNILAFSFVLLAIHFLIEKRRFYSIIFVGFILIASLIHMSSLFFLLYLPASFLKRKNVVILTLVLVVLLYVGSTINFINEFIINYLGEDKFQIISKTILYDGMVGRISALMITILEFWIVYFLLCKMGIDTTDRYSHILFCINILSIIFVPLTLRIGSGFNRIPTLLSLVNYCYFCTKISSVQFQKNRVFIYSTVFVLMTALFIANFRNSELRDALLIPLFEENEWVKYF